MPTTIDVRSLLRSRREQKTDGVLDLAKRLAKNEAVDPEEILAVVNAAKVGDDELADLIDLLRRRDELRALAATAPSAEKELAQVRDGIRRQREALEEAERRYRLAVEPLILQESRAEAKVREAVAAATSLMAPTNLPRVMVDRIESARKHLQQTGRELQEIEDIISRQTRRAEMAAEKLNADGGLDLRMAQYDDPDRRKLLKFDITRLIEDVRSGRRQVAECEPRLAQAKAAHDAALAAFQEAERTAREF